MAPGSCRTAECEDSPAQVSLINPDLPGARCLALAPTLAWAGFKGGSSNLGNVSPQVTLSIASGLGVYIYFWGGGVSCKIEFILQLLGGPLA